MWCLGHCLYRYDRVGALGMGARKRIAGQAARGRGLEDMRDRRRLIEKATSAKAYESTNAKRKRRPREIMRETEDKLDRLPRSSGLRPCCNVGRPCPIHGLVTTQGPRSV